MEDRGGGVEADGVVEPVRLGVRAHVGRGRLLDADRDELQALVSMGLVGVAEDRRLLLAGWTPCGEERQPDGSAAQVGEADRPSVEVLEGDRGAIHRALELGGQIAGLETLGRGPDDVERGAG